MLKACALLAVIAGSCLADIQVTISYTADGQTAVTKIWSNGTRMRYDYGSGVLVLRYCDQKKMVQIDEKSKSYVVVPEPAPAKATADSKSAVNDTGERKELFGHQSRHLKITEAGDDKDKKERTETDGWYFDFSELGPCFTGGGYADRGFPASYTISAVGENGKPTSTAAMQVTSVIEAPLASNLFDLPEGFKDSTPREIQKGAAVKAPGAIRVGAVLIRDKANPAVHNSGLYDRLTGQLLEAKLDLVQLEDGLQDAIQHRAQETACDFVLYTELAGVGKPASDKVTGLLHKAPGLGHVTGGDGMEARIEYRLVPAAGGTPVLASTAIGKAGTNINLKAAALLASNFIPMAMAARMFSGALNPTMMTALTSGHGYGASMARADPMMGGIASLLQMATGPAVSDAQNPMTAEAITAAIDLEGKAIIAQLNPKP
jgi:hypothetical protein